MAKRYGVALFQSKIESSLVHGTAFHFICCWKRRNGVLGYREESVAKVHTRDISMLQVTDFLWGYFLRLPGRGNYSLGRVLRIWLRHLACVENSFCRGENGDKSQLQLSKLVYSIDVFLVHT